MSRVRKEPKYIGSAIRNDMEAGDELCISLDNGRYYNIEVSYVLDGESGQGDREVFCGDEDAKHIGLVVDVEETETEGAYGTEVEWDVYAYTLTEDPDSPTDKYEIEALCIIGDGVHSPDMTVDEIVEGAEGNDPEISHEEVNEMVETFHEMREDLDYVIRQAEKARESEITLAEYENRLSAYEVRKGGNPALDGL